MLTYEALCDGVYWFLIVNIYIYTYCLNFNDVLNIIYRSPIMLLQNSPIRKGKEKTIFPKIEVLNCKLLILSHWNALGWVVLWWCGPASPYN